MARGVGGGRTIRVGGGLVGIRANRIVRAARGINGVRVGGGRVVRGMRVGGVPAIPAVRVGGGRVVRFLRVACAVGFGRGAAIAQLCVGAVERVGVPGLLTVEGAEAAALRDFVLLDRKSVV